MRLRRLGLIITRASGMLWAPLATDAQQAGKVPQLGHLSGTAPEEGCHECR